MVLHFIEQVSTSAIRLQILVDETSSKISQMGLFRLFEGLLNTLARWIALAVALFLLGTVKKSTAALLVAGAGESSINACLMKLTSSRHDLHHLHG